MNAKKDIFVETKDQRKLVSKAVLAVARRKSTVEGLIENADFKEWFFGTMVELCAFGDDLSPVDEWHQGLRAAAAFIRRSLLIADGAPEFLAQLDKRYFDGVRRGMEDAERKTTQNERG